MAPVGSYRDRDLFSKGGPGTHLEDRPWVRQHPDTSMCPVEISGDARADPLSSRSGAGIGVQRGGGEKGGIGKVPQPKIQRRVLRISSYPLLVV